MKKILITSAILSLLYISFAAYKTLYSNKPEISFCGYNFRYPQYEQQRLEGFAAKLENVDAGNIDLVKSERKKCLAKFSLLFPFLIWVFAGCLTTLTPWGWKLKFWRRKSDGTEMAGVSEAKMVVIIFGPWVFMFFAIYYLFSLILI